MSIASLPRRKAFELNRHPGKVLDEAAQSGGVIVAATAHRPEMVVAPESQWRRLSDMAMLGRVLADVLSDLADLFAGRRPSAPRVAWISGLDPDDLPLLARELAAAASLSMETSNPEPLKQTLYAWKSTAEFALAGAQQALDNPDWDSVVELVRPAEKAD